MKRTLAVLLALGTSSSANPTAVLPTVRRANVTYMKGTDDPATVCIDIFRKNMDSGETGIDKTNAEGVDIRVIEEEVTPWWERANGEKRGHAEWLIPKGYSKKKNQKKKRILFLHGGGYAWYSPSDFYRPLTTRLAEAADMPVLAIDYRLTPEFLFPGGLEDAVTGLKYIWENGPEGEGPADYVYLAGDSAGGGLVTSLLLAVISGTLDGYIPINVPDVKPADAAVQLSTYTDLSCSLPSYRTRVWVEATKTGDPIFSNGNTVEDLISSRNAGWSYIGRNRGYTLENEIASPYWARDEWLAQLPPMQLIVGDAELMLDDSVAFGEKVAKAGGAIPEVLVYPRMWHDHLFYTDGCIGVPNHLPEAVDGYVEWGNFLKRMHP